LAQDPHHLSEILDRIVAIAASRERAPVSEIVEALGHRGHGPLLLMPALIDISPIGSIPGLPTLLALLIVLVASQIVIGRDHLTLPGFVERRTLPGAKLAKTAKWLAPVAGRLDRWFHGRLCFLTEGVGVRIAAAMCIGLALAVPPLELIPLATTLPMAAIATFGIALLVRDGVLMVAALLLGCAAVTAGVLLLV
jgi:hypothetical protein